MCGRSLTPRFTVLHAVSVCSGELKEETWKKVNGWLSSYRAQKRASDSLLS